MDERLSGKTLVAWGFRLGRRLPEAIAVPRRCAHVGKLANVEAGKAYMREPLKSGNAGCAR